MADVHVISVWGQYESYSTDHSTRYYCEDFEIDGIDDEDRIESLSPLDECPSQGVRKVTNGVIMDLRDCLVIGHVYCVNTKIEAIMVGYDSKLFTFTEEMREQLKRDAGDYEEEV